MGEHCPNILEKRCYGAVSPIQKNLKKLFKVLLGALMFMIRRLISLLVGLHFRIHPPEKFMLSHISFDLSRREDSKYTVKTRYNEPPYYETPF